MHETTLITVLFWAVVSFPDVLESIGLWELVLWGENSKALFNTKFRFEAIGNEVGLGLGLIIRWDY